MSTIIIIIIRSCFHNPPPNQVANLGQCFVALDPSAFTDSFPERLQVDNFLDWIVLKNFSCATAALTDCNDHIYTSFWMLCC